MATTLDPDRPIRWGIQGAGAIARQTAATIAASPDSVVQAVAARDAYRAAAFAGEFGAATSYGDYRALADDPDVDVVYVATTHGQHHPQVRTLLEAGKPVLVEKSFTLTADQAQDLVDLAAREHVFCMEALWTRCLPAVRAAVEAAETRLGRIVALRSDLSRRFPYDPTSRLWDPATGGGAALDVGVYVTHLAWAFLGPPESLAISGRVAPNGVDASVALQLGYPDGATAQLAASFETTTADPHTVVSGTEGHLVMYGRTHDPDRVVFVSPDGVEETVAVGRHEGFTPEIVEVERALRDGDLESPLVPLVDTVGVLRVLDAAREELGVSYGALEEV
ncbi:Gfo/Idh/MocA family protein [Jatrophihabitans sp. YIM 134969]